jgi:hypothetical protein
MGIRAVDRNRGNLEHAEHQADLKGHQHGRKGHGEDPRQVAGPFVYQRSKGVSHGFR